MINGADANSVLMAVMQNKTLDEAGLPVTHEFQDYYDKVAQEINDAPQNVMVSPVWDYNDDAKYDTILASLKPQLDQALQDWKDQQSTITKSAGEYQVSEEDAPKKYTLGAMYIPNQLDAHSEWTDPAELQKAVWDYVRSGDRRIRLQHNKDIVAGEWVEIMSWVWEITVPIIMPDGSTVSHTYPKDTVFLGVVWEDWAWELIVAGKILGYSIGGKARRLYVDMPAPEDISNLKKDGDAPASGPSIEAVHVDGVMPNKKRGKQVVSTEDEEPEVLTKSQVSEIIQDALKAYSPIIQVNMPESKPRTHVVTRDEHGFIEKITEE